MIRSFSKLLILRKSTAYKCRILCVTARNIKKINGRKDDKVNKKKVGGFLCYALQVLNFNIEQVYALGLQL
jgi:hypothetical protein